MLYGSPALRVQILNIWKMRNLSIWLVDPFLILPMKSAYSAIKGFDWVLISCVVCIIQIFMICTLRAGNPYHKQTGFHANKKLSIKQIFRLFRDNLFWFRALFIRFSNRLNFSWEKMLYRYIFESSKKRVNNFPPTSARCFYTISTKQLKTGQLKKMLIIMVRKTK